MITPKIGKLYEFNRTFSMPLHRTRGLSDQEDFFSAGSVTCMLEQHKLYVLLECLTWQRDHTLRPENVYRLKFLHGDVVGYIRVLDMYFEQLFTEVPVP